MTVDVESKVADCLKAVVQNQHVAAKLQLVTADAAKHLLAVAANQHVVANHKVVLLS